MYKNSKEQKSLNNEINLKRNSSLLSTSSSLRVKKIKLRNEFSPFHIIGKTSNNKNILNFPVCISLFTNNYSINESNAKLKLNQNSKLNMKFMHLNNSSIKENKKFKENKRVMSRNPNSFFINSFSPKSLNAQSSNISNYYKFSSSGMKNLSKPKLVKLNYSPSYKFTQQNIPTKNKNNSMTNTTIEQDLSAIKSTNNTLNNNKISKKKYLLSSPHTSEGLEKTKKEEKEKIPKILPRKNKIKNYEDISNLKYSKNSKIYDEINKIINESNLKRKYKLNIGTHSNKSINSNNSRNNNLSSINNKIISEINSANLEKSTEDIETNIENNLENNIENKNKIIEDIKNTNIEKTEINDNNPIKKLKEKMEEKNDFFKTKGFKQLKKNVSEFQKKEKEKKKIAIDNKDNKDTKGQPSTYNTTIDKNILKAIKKNKFYLTICRGKTNDIYRDNDFLNDLNKSTKNVNHMNLFAKKTEMLINCKKSTEQIINHEKNKLKQNQIFEKIYSYLSIYFREENSRKKDKNSKEIAEYINYIKKLKIEFKFICNLDFVSRSYIQNEYEFEGFPYILTGRKSTKHLNLIMENSFAKFGRRSSKDNFKIKKTKLKDKDEDKMNKSVIDMLAIQDNILKSLYYYNDSKKIKKGNQNNNNLKEKKEKKKILDRDENKKKMIIQTNSSTKLLNILNKKNSMKLSNLNLNQILNNRKMVKRSSTLIRDNILKNKNSQNSDININHYSILQQKNFFKKRKLSSNDKNSKNDNIFFINEKDNSIEDSQEDDKIYIELIKLIFEGKNNLFINLYKKNKEYIDINQDLFEGNTLLILSAKDGNLFISKFLCEQGAKINAQNQRGNTALHYAIGKQFYGVADVLTRNGAKENIRNNLGLTPWECIEHNIED